MQSTVRDFLALITRWSRAIVLCMIICGGMAFVITMLMPRMYTAETTLIIIDSSPPRYEGGPQSEGTIPYLFSEFIKKDVILQPVAARYGLTTAQLKDMVTTKPQSDTLSVLVDVNNNDAMLATQLSCEVTKSFVNYAMQQNEPQLQFNILKPNIPTDPSPIRPTQNVLLGALAGLVLALLVITAYNWNHGRFAQGN